MSLRNDFHVANAHAMVYQSLGQYIALTNQLTNDPAIKAAFEHAPKKMTGDRNFLQMVLDDAMESFVSIMARTIQNSSTEFKDIPHEFYLKLMRNRHGTSVTKQQAMDQLKQEIDAKNAQPAAIMGRPRTPDFLRVIMSEVEPQTLANLANGWSAVIRGFSTLMMSESALAANQSAIEIMQGAMMEVQQHINKIMEMRGQKPGGPGANDNGQAEDEGVKIHKVEDLDDLETEMDRLIGMDDPKELIREIEARVRHLRILKDAGLSSDKDGGGIEHFVFTGNPGTGKTTFARLIGKIYHDNGMLKKGHVVEADRGDLVAGYVGQTALKTKKVINEALDGVLFIDEAYLLKGEGNDFGKEAMGTLLKSMEMHKDRLVVVIAGYPGPMSELVKTNPGLSRRFKYHMNYPDFSKDELMQIFDKNMKRWSRNITPEARAKAEAMLVNNKKSMGEHFGNAGTVENLVELLNNKLSLKLENDGTLQEYEDLKATGADIPKELKDKLVTITLDIVDQVRLEASKGAEVTGEIDTSGLGKGRTPQPAPKIGNGPN